MIIPGIHSLEMPGADDSCFFICRFQVTRNPLEQFLFSLCQVADGGDLAQRVRTGIVGSSANRKETFSRGIQ